jgi:hypothetical protein
MKLKSESAYKENYLNSILSSIEKELQAKAEIDRDNGMSVKIR